MEARSHWERVYGTKKPTEVSWYQSTAEPSLSVIRNAAPDPSTAVIDVGGGASTLVDGLLAHAYSNITVLDVSAAALAQAQSRLGASASRVVWLEANVLECPLPVAAFGVWHDRAVFHFLTDPTDRQRYVAQVRRSVQPGGHVMVATFATDGPVKCSGLEVVRYAPEELHGQFGDEFEMLDCIREEHQTPSGVIQPFIYCMCRARGGQTTG